MWSSDAFPCLPYGIAEAVARRWLVAVSQKTGFVGTAILLGLMVGESAAAAPQLMEPGGRRTLAQTNPVQTGPVQTGPPQANSPLIRDPQSVDSQRTDLPRLDGSAVSGRTSGAVTPLEGTPAAATGLREAQPLAGASDSAGSLMPAALMQGDGLLEEERVNIFVYEKCNRSVVHISTKSVALDSFLQVKVRAGGGSGSVLSRSGLILTNQHVIDGARQITVSLYNGLRYPAELVGEDPDTDIAVLKIDAPESELIPIEWGDSAKLREGQRIYAIGNPFGLERSLSAGMISSLNRQIPSKKRRTMFSLIQIDATINQGNSGGPLLNTRGQLIGMNTAILSSDGDSAGVGFAIPSATIARIAPELIQHGRFIRPAIGITRVYENERGLLIIDTVPGGPADRAGLRGFRIRNQIYQRGNEYYSQPVLDTSEADLIVAADGKPVRSTDELLNQIESKKPGDVVTVTVERGDMTVDVPVQLGQSN